MPFFRLLSREGRKGQLFCTNCTRFPSKCGKFRKFGTFNSPILSEVVGLTTPHGSIVVVVVGDKPANYPSKQGFERGCGICGGCGCPLWP